MTVPQYYECGICGCWHPATWNGDCRDDGNRLTGDEIDARHGALGWEAVEISDLPGHAEEWPERSTLWRAA